jgi:SOS-response transcriptional repressor LexA
MSGPRKPRKPLQEWEKNIITMIDNLLTERGLHKKWLAAQLGIKPAGISPYFSGKISFKEKIPKLAMIFDKDPEYFLQGQPNVEPAALPQKRKVPLISWVRAGVLHEPMDIFEPGFADEWIASNASGENSFALRVTGNSMYPEFLEGDIIVIDPAQEPASGDYAVVKINDEVTFKQIHFYLNKIELIPVNKERYEIIEISRDDGFNVQVIGKVVEQIRRR